MWRDHAVGFFQRSSRGRDVVEHKAAFVHRGQQVGAQRFVAEEGRHHQHHRKYCNPPRAIQRETQPAFVELDHAAEASAQRRFFRRQQLVFLAEIVARRGFAVLPDE